MTSDQGKAAQGWEMVDVYPSQLPHTYANLWAPDGECIGRMRWHNAETILAALQRPEREAALVEALRTIAGKHTMVTATGKYRPWKALAVKLQRIAHEALISPPGLSEGGG